MNNRDHRIIEILTHSFSPTHLHLDNVSYQHAGHNSEAANTGDTHYVLEIASEAFNGLNRVKQHQLVYAALKSEFATGLHAMEIRVF